MTVMMREFPRLPRLSIAQCLQVFTAVGVPQATAAKLSGFSRMQLHRWSKGQYARPHSVNHDYVSTLAYRLLRASRAKTIPKPGFRNYMAWADAIKDENYPVHMSDMAPEQLLPKAWFDQFNTETDDAAT